MEIMHFRKSANDICVITIAGESATMQETYLFFEEKEEYRQVVDFAIGLILECWRSVKKTESEDYIIESLKNLDILDDVIEEENQAQRNAVKVLDNARDFLMQIQPSEINIEDMLEILGFGRNGLRDGNG